ncbi:MAG: restriction endonuclease subunit R [Candidatus Zixiibacteriota bacterium]|nr:MAG: restriction endonuclease subunit R [candidate division Zixibacteria bacterium]
MHPELITFVEDLKAGRVDWSDEASTKQGIILRALHLLGWDIFNPGEVKPEYVNSAGNRPDYSLRLSNTTKVFIEVKKVQENLDNHQAQLLNYAFQEGVRMAVLTNGFTWWFYLPLNEGSWDQRKFYSIDIQQQKPDLIADKFHSFLSREKISNGTAFDNAEELFRSRQRNYILLATLPKAWNKIIEDSDELLLDLLNETTEKICGFKADPSMVEEFFNTNKGQFIVGANIYTQGVIKPHHRKRMKPLEQPVKLNIQYTGKNLTSFVFDGKRYDADKWIQLLSKICDLMRLQFSKDFDRVLNLQGKVRPYFSLNENRLRAPQKIPNTDIFMETNLGAESIAKLAYKVILLFGYKKNSLEINATPKLHQ